MCSDPPEDPYSKCQQWGYYPDEGPAALGPQKKAHCCTGRHVKSYSRLNLPKGSLRKILFSLLFKIKLPVLKEAVSIAVQHSSLHADYLYFHCRDCIVIVHILSRVLAILHSQFCCKTFFLSAYVHTRYAHYMPIILLTVIYTPERKLGLTLLEGVTKLFHFYLNSSQVGGSVQKHRCTSNFSSFSSCLIQMVENCNCWIKYTLWYTGVFLKCPGI